MSPGLKKLLIVFLIILALVGGYWFGTHRGTGIGFTAGYQKAQADDDKAYQAAAEQAAQEAVAESNADVFAEPASTEDAGTDPLAETKATLNPF